MCASRQLIRALVSPRIQETALLDPSRRILRMEEVVGGKIPYSIGLKDDAPFVFAGLWEGWKDPATEESPDAGSCLRKTISPVVMRMIAIANDGVQ